MGGVLNSVGTGLAASGNPLLMAAGGGLDILGSVLGGNQANQAANRQWQLIQDELARRNGIQAGMAPGLMTSAGITDPAQRASMMGAFSGQSVGEGGMGGVQPSTSSSNVMTPKSAILGGLVGSKLFGTAHLNANDLVSKVENPFGQAMASAKSLQDLKGAYQTYLQGVNNFSAAGGNNAQVAKQSLNNPKLQQTFSTLWQQCGGGQAPVLGQ